ncbi:cytochrome P460 family protein [Candidatus Desantisbacteria bacterium]|nr:cytochrome P460 family protein [Candidatus Desantisbacteria bacterium]
MKKNIILILYFIIILNGILFANDEAARSPNGINLPAGYKDWRVVALSQREDNKTLRVIIGNDTAIKAVRDGKTNPWPDGSILAKIVWKNKNHEKWEKAIVPGEFVHVEFMVKDSQKYKETGGWGFARWIGLEQKPYGENSSFVNECFNCHKPVKDNDYVFTSPALMP